LKVESAARSLLGKNVLIKNLCDLDALAKTDENADDASKTSDTVKVVVIGTLFKNQPLKPNILKELSDDQVNLQLIQHCKKKKFILS
jgi:hypothetical protein